MNIKQSSKYSSCDAAQYSIHIFTFMLNKYYGEEEGFKGFQDWTPVKLLMKVEQSVTPYG